MQVTQPEPGVAGRFILPKTAILATLRRPAQTETWSSEPDVVISEFLRWKAFALKDTDILGAWHLLD